MALIGVIYVKNLQKIHCILDANIHFARHALQLIWIQILQECVQFVINLLLSIWNNLKKEDLKRMLLLKEKNLLCRELILRIGERVPRLKHLWKNSQKSKKEIQMQRV